MALQSAGGRVTSGQYGVITTDGDGEWFVTCVCCKVKLTIGKPVVTERASLHTRRVKAVAMFKAANPDWHHNRQLGYVCPECLATKEEYNGTPLHTSTFKRPPKKG